jgi:hypothetical protein
MAKIRASRFSRVFPDRLLARRKTLPVRRLRLHSHRLPYRPGLDDLDGKALITYRSRSAKVALVPAKVKPDR